MEYLVVWQLVRRQRMTASIVDIVNEIKIKCPPQNVYFTWSSMVEHQTNLVRVVNFAAALSPLLDCVVCEAC